MKITKEYLEENGFDYDTVIDGNFSLIINNLNNDRDVEFKLEFYRDDDSSYYSEIIDEDIFLNIETIEEFETFLKIMGRR